MPEGPSIILLKEAAQRFEKKKVLEASGYAKIDFDRIQHKQVTSLKTWGKHFLICFNDCFIRVHLGLFGSYTIDEEKKVNPILSLHFANGTLNFYVSKIQLTDGDPNEVYDWSADIMSKKWSPAKALKKLEAIPKKLICDALFEQQIFSGSGNIIKNEMLFRARLHPESLVGKIPAKSLKALTNGIAKYAFQFLEWKGAGVFSKHWKVYQQETCPRCNIPLKVKVTGKTKRKTYFCTNCQILYKK